MNALATTVLVHVQSAGSTTDAITAWATVGLGAVTAILASIGIWQAVITRKALKAAEQDTREATKSRIDQAAPRVTFVADGADQHQEKWLVPIQPGLPYEVPRFNDVELALSGWFIATNEGRSTAVLKAPKGTVYTKPDDKLSLSQLAQYNYSPETQFTYLRPEQSTRMLVEFRKTLAQWVEGSNVHIVESSHEPVGQSGEYSIDVIVDDTFTDGISDTTTLVIIGEPIAEYKGTWRTTEPYSTLRVDRTIRTYPGQQKP